MKKSLINQFIIYSNKTPEQMKKVILDNVDTKNSIFIRSYSSKYLFFGEVSQDSFTISICSPYRSPFLPIINGKLVEEKGKIKIEIQMKPYASIKFFEYTGIGILLLAEVLCVGTLTIKFNILFIFPALAIWAVYSFFNYRIEENMKMAKKKMLKIFGR